MEFGINEGFELKGASVRQDVSRLTDDEIRAGRAEFSAAGEARGLWVSAGAGALALATELDIPAMRAQLLATVTEGASLYTNMINGINQGRGKKADKIPVAQPGEYRERAEDWLTDEIVQATTQLPSAINEPMLVVPRLTRAVTIEETVVAWQQAANGRLWDSKRMKFLKKWTEDELSGFDTERAEDSTFAVIPTAYDEARQGTVSQQNHELQTLQADYSEIEVVPILSGVLLGSRYTGERRDWRDSYVRAINLIPKGEGVPNAYVHSGGDAYVDYSGVEEHYAARLQVSK